MPGTVYLLHFAEPLPRDRRDGPRPVSHYLGWAGRLSQRLEHHRGGTGARLTAVLVERGIGFELVRTWTGDRSLERRLKNRHEHTRLCPKCRAPGAHRARIAIACAGCSRPVCSRCQRHLIRVRAGRPNAHWRHSIRIGCVQR